MVKPNVVGEGPSGTDYTYANKPVVYISFFDAMRFVNWLENGQPTGEQGPGTTEDGVYTINDGISEVRKHESSFFIPTEDEWYKAAYHDASASATSNYYDYPTGTDVVPNNNPPSSDTGNSANFSQNGFTNDDSGLHLLLTDVGSYTLSASPYGTFDQGGNVWEWNETYTYPGRGMRGSSYVNYSRDLQASHRFFEDPSGQYGNLGFRVAAAIPEPSTLLLAVLSATGLSLRRQPVDFRR